MFHLESLLHNLNSHTSMQCQVFSFHLLISFCSFFFLFYLFCFSGMQSLLENDHTLAICFSCTCMLGSVNWAFHPLFVNLLSLLHSNNDVCNSLLCYWPYSLPLFLYFIAEHYKLINFHQVFAFVPLMYMCVCTYYSLFKVGMLMFYSLTPRQTSSVNLLMICS